MKLLVVLLLVISGSCFRLPIIRGVIIHRNDIFRSYEPLRSTSSDESVDHTIVNSLPNDIVENNAVNTSAESNSSAELELSLQNSKNDLMKKLYSARLELTKLKDDVAESGKQGYHMIQAEIVNFKKQQQNILQNMVSSRKKDVGLRLIDEIDKLQNQLIEFNNTISNGDKESIFTPLLSNYYDALKLCGYTAFDSAEIGQSFDASKHESLSNVTSGVIVNVISSGYMFDGQIVRLCKVVLSPMDPWPSLNSTLNDSMAMNSTLTEVATESGTISTIASSQVSLEGDALEQIPLNSTKEVEKYSSSAQ